MLYEDIFLDDQELFRSTTIHINTPAPDGFEMNCDLEDFSESEIRYKDSLFYLNKIGTLTKVVKIN